jgi:histidine ammonia-lyase
LKEKGLENGLQLSEGDCFTLLSGKSHSKLQATWAVNLAEIVSKNADIVFSCTFEALAGVKNAFHPKIQEIRNHKG